MKLHSACWASSAKLWHHFQMRMQVLWGELGDSPLESLSVLSSEVAVPLLRSQIRHGSMPDSAALELTDSLQAFVSSGKLLPTSHQCLAYCAWCTRQHGWPNSDPLFCMCVTY